MCVCILTLRRCRRQDPIGDRLPALLRPGMPFPFGNQLGSRTGYDRDTTRTAENYWELSKIDTRTGKGPKGVPPGGADNAKEFVRKYRSFRLRS